MKMKKQQHQVVTLEIATDFSPPPLLNPPVNCSLPTGSREGLKCGHLMSLFVLQAPNISCAMKR